MTILIANPPWYAGGDTAATAAQWGVRAGASAPRLLPARSRLVPWPADLAAAAGFLREQEHKVMLVDSIATRESVSGFCDRFGELLFDVAALATSPASLCDDLPLIETLAAAKPLILLWPGRPDGAEALLSIDGVRAVVCGEWEMGLLAAMQIDTPNVYPADPIRDLDALPIAYRDYTVHRYRLPLAGLPDGPQLQLRATRQVPDGPRRWRSPSSLTEEIGFCRDNWPRLSHVAVQDDALNSDPDRFATLTAMLEAEGWPWAAKVRLSDERDAETLSLATSAAALEVAFDRVPDMVGSAALALLARKGVAVTLAPTPDLDRDAVRAVADETRAAAIVPAPAPAEPLSVREALRQAQQAAPPTNAIPAAEASAGRRLFVVGQHVPVYMPPWLVRGADELGFDAVPIDLFDDPRNVLPLLDSAPDDIVLADRGLGLAPEILARIPARTVLYSPEVLPTLTGSHPHAERRYAELSGVAPHFEHVVLHDGHGLEYLRAHGHDNIRGVVMLPHEPAWHRDLGMHRDLDVVFVGNGSEHRVEWIEHLAREGVSVHWPQVWGDDFIRTLNRAKIVLNLHYTPLPNTEQRVVEALACGCFVVTEALTDPEAFVDGEHLVVITRETAAETIRHYLDHPDERERIATAGKAWVAERHTAKACVEQIVALIPERA